MQGPGEGHRGSVERDIGGASVERAERERVAVVAAVVEPRGSVVGWGEKDRGYGGSEGRGRQADMTSKHKPGQARQGTNET